MRLVKSHVLYVITKVGTSIMYRYKDLGTEPSRKIFEDMPFTLA